VKDAKRHSQAEDLSETTSGKKSAGDDPAGTLGAKKKTLLEKLDSLSVGLKACQNAHGQILSALTNNHHKAVEDIQRQILALKENISGPEKKKFKKAKLSDELAYLQRTWKKLGLKPELGRKKDLDKINDYLICTFRTLDSLNDKFMSEREASDSAQT
jgi:hypothetical protein